MDNVFGEFHTEPDHNQVMKLLQSKYSMRLNLKAKKIEAAFVLSDEDEQENDVSYLPKDKLD